MTTSQEKALKDKLTRLGYPSFEVLPGEDEVLMLYMQGRLICGVDYALSMSDEALKALIDETLEVA
jgi:hypothetical protein